MDFWRNEMLDKFVQAPGVVRFIEQLVGLSETSLLKSQGKRELKDSLVLIVCLCNFNQQQYKNYYVFLSSITAIVYRVYANRANSL